MKYFKKYEIAKAMKYAAAYKGFILFHIFNKKYFIIRKNYFILGTIFHFKFGMLNTIYYLTSGNW